MSRTFAVSDVALAPKRLPALSRTKSLTSLLRGRVEQMWTSDASLVLCTSQHPLVVMADAAFFDHRPIILSPDAIWFCIAQGFARHVNLHVEQLRRRFVRHEGKVRLVVERADFALGQSNPWPEAFAAFSDQLAAHLGKLRDLVVADFSTTGPVERAGSEVVLMDAFQGYFKYEVLFGCGIPAVTLLGTPADWRSVRQRAAMLAEFDLESWTHALIPVLDRIVRTAEGHDDPEFWQSFYHYKSDSMGGSELTGWIHVLFPYLEDRQTGAVAPNPYIDQWERAYEAARTTKNVQMRGPAPGAIPSGLASAPVEVTDVRSGNVHQLHFVAGMFGVTQDSAGALAPEFGWAVVHDPDLSSMG
jgi:hypothetical protein